MLVTETTGIKLLLKIIVLNPKDGGSVTYLLNGEAVKSYNLVTVRDVEKRDFAWCLRYVWELVSGIGLN